jgi:hypothetical protein
MTCYICGFFTVIRQRILYLPPHRLPKYVDNLTHRIKTSDFCMRLGIGLSR